MKLHEDTLYNFDELINMTCQYIIFGTMKKDPCGTIYSEHQSKIPSITYIIHDETIYYNIMYVLYIDSSEKQHKCAFVSKLRLKY